MTAPGAGRGPGPPRTPPAQDVRARLALLSARERAVFALVAAGYNGPEIAAQLGISAKTVDTYRQRIANKVAIRHRTEYVRFALRAELLHA